MDGIFLRKNFNVHLFLLFLCGFAFIGLYFFLGIVDPEAPGELRTFLYVGILLWSFVIPSWLLNFGAYFRIEGDSVRAKYHWCGRLDCKIDEIAFAMAQTNALTILLKNGKRHVIMGIGNARALAAQIRRQSFRLETEAPGVLRKKLEAAQTNYKKNLFWTFGGCAMMFLNILIGVLLTGGRELFEFSTLDWILFTVTCVAELAIMIVTFYFAGKGGRQLLPVEQLKYRLKGAYIAFQPLPPGTVKRVCTDADHTRRIIVYGFPNDERVYCCIQRFVSETELGTVRTTDLYDSEEALDEAVDFSPYIDIIQHLTHAASTQC